MYEECSFLDTEIDNDLIREPKRIKLSDSSDLTNSTYLWAVWLRKFLNYLEVVPNVDEPMTIYCDNTGAVANSKEPRSHKRSKHIERKYHLIREIVQRGDVEVKKIFV